MKAAAQLLALDVPAIPITFKGISTGKQQADAGD